MDDIEVKLLDGEGGLINFWYFLGHHHFSDDYFTRLFNPPSHLEKPKFIEVGVVEEP